MANAEIVCDRCKGTGLCPDDYHVRQRIAWWFDGKESVVIDNIAQKQGLSRQAVLRQALRVYQLVAAGTHELRQVEPFDKSE
jgi:hypothetical protein